MSFEPDEQGIEQALMDDPAIEPSRQFTYRVMRSVREEVSLREAIAFPWRTLGVGVGLSVAVGLVWVVWPIPAATTVSLTDTLSGVVLAVQWGTVTLAGTLAVTWWSSRLVNRS